MPATAVIDSSSPELVTKDSSAGSGSQDGLWKLTLDKQPPPGVKLVLFVPVCPTQTNGLTLPSAISPTLSTMQVQLQPVGLNAAPLNAPLDLVTGIKQDPECEAPLDLSKKCKSPKSSLSDVPALKSELEEFEISGEADDTDGQELKNSDSKTFLKPVPGKTGTYTEAETFKMDPIDQSPVNVNATSSGLIIDIKNEPQSPVLDARSSRSCEPIEKEIKMESEVSCHADMEKKNVALSVRGQNKREHCLQEDTSESQRTSLQPH